MSLGEIIERLEKEDPSRILKIGWGEPGSYRGYYQDVAFEPANNVTIGSMLENAKSALGQTFCGYKGGDFKMNEYTDCWIAEYGRSNGAQISDLLLDFMLGESNTAEDDSV
jgi:hypothetical protein